VRGRVVDAAGAGISGASVTAYGGAIATTRNVTSDANGDYSLGWVPVGNYYISVASGGTTRVTPANVASGATSTVNFAFSTQVVFGGPRRRKPLGAAGPTQPNQRETVGHQRPSTTRRVEQ
jgi:hypothetical protein